MRYPESNLRKERLTFFPPLPVLAVKRLAFRFEIEIRLAVIRRIIPRPTKIIGYEFHRLGQRITIAPVAAMIMRPDTRLVHPRNHRRTARRTNRPRHKGIGISNTFTRQPIKIRRLHRRCPIAADIRTDILTHNPQNIGPLVVHACAEDRRLRHTSKRQPRRTRPRKLHKITTIQLTSHYSLPFGNAAFQPLPSNHNTFLIPAGAYIFCPLLVQIAQSLHNIGPFARIVFHLRLRIRQITQE